MAPLALFVCTGNTCRSAMAEYFFRLALPTGSRWRAMSAGVSTSDGKPASMNTLQAVAELGGDIGAHRSRQMTRQLASDAAVIVAMTHGHADFLHDFFCVPRAKIVLLGSFIPKTTDDSIHDPFGGDISEYRRCRDLIRKAMPGLIRHLDTLDMSGGPSR